MAHAGTEAGPRGFVVQRADSGQARERNSAPTTLIVLGCMRVDPISYVAGRYKRCAREVTVHYAAEEAETIHVSRRRTCGELKGLKAVWVAVTNCRNLLRGPKLSLRVESERVQSINESRRLCVACHA